MHAFKHLQQSPALALITLCVQNAFSLEVHVIDERIGSLWRSEHSFELLLHIGPIGRHCLSQHFWQRGFQPGNQEFGLEIDRIGEKLA